MVNKEQVREFTTKLLGLVKLMAEAKKRGVRLVLVDRDRLCPSCAMAWEPPANKTVH